jgi:hypothetical protein
LYPLRVNDEKDAAKQKTPKGAEIPVPKRKEFYGSGILGA